MWYPLIVRNRPILWFGYFFSNPGTITVTNVPPRVRVRGRGALSPIPGVLVYHGNPSENMTRLHLVHPHKIQAFDWVASVDSRSSRCSTQRYERTVSQMPWDQRFLILRLPGASDFRDITETLRTRYWYQVWWCCAPAINMGNNSQNSIPYEFQVSVSPKTTVQFLRR